VGRYAKLYGGGGERVSHSRVSAPHGSSPAGVPRRRLQSTFTTSIAMLANRITVPAVATRFSVPQPVSGRYVYTRRGMPWRPSWCIGKNVRLKPTKRSQKFQRPRRSESIRPVIFGNQ